MPFNNNALTELRIREGLNQRQFRRDLEKVVGLSCSPASICQWEHGGYSPHASIIDKIYKYASKKGHEDLEFYVRPGQEKKK